MYSVVIPVYRNAEFIPLLIKEFSRISTIVQERLGLPIEFVFVVDGSPDNSYELLEEALPKAPFSSQLIMHARNFGSFAAIRTGLKAASGDYIGIIAADLQEPPDLLLQFAEALKIGAYDIVIGVREGRDDPFLSRASADLFWAVYRKLINREIPERGVDVFACNRRVRDELLQLQEAHSSLVGLVFWLGFRRGEIPYRRRARAYGRSAWTLRKKFNYLLDSVFAFTDLPIRILTLLGLLGTLFAVLFGISIAIMRLVGNIDVPGYAATIVVIAFFGALNTLGIGLIGSYTWRAYENTKNRPFAIVQRARSFQGAGPQPAIGAGPTYLATYRASP